MNVKFVLQLWVAVDAYTMLQSFKYNAHNAQTVLLESM